MVCYLLRVIKSQVPCAEDGSISSPLMEIEFVLTEPILMIKLFLPSLPNSDVDVILCRHPMQSEEACYLYNLVYHVSSDDYEQLQIAVVA